MPAASEPIAVNTGPLIALAASDDLDLLRQLHGRVLVPQAVVDEFGRGVHRAPGGDLPAWFEVHTLAAPVPPVLTAHLDLGEACAIALALERGLGLVAIDERRGRLLARDAGLRVTGSLGVLLRAKRRGMIDEIRPRLDRMRAAGVWISPRLLDAVLAEAGERG